MTNWNFTLQQPNDKIRESNIDEFYDNSRVGEPLVREGIQNSLDAARNGESVRVRIFVSGEDMAVPAERIAPFFSGFWDHLGAPEQMLYMPPETSEECPFLVFEDFGTHGLRGDTEQYIPDPQNNDFLNFYRAEGRSEKSEQDRGRYGFGKHVFLKASRARVLFGLTVRSDDLINGTSCFAVPQSKRPTVQARWHVRQITRRRTDHTS